MKPSGKALLKRLEACGLLLASDQTLPSVASLVAKTPMKGSWWSHPKGREIWLALEALEDHPDVLFVKLVSGKVTLVHRRLWPALYAAAASREAWQMKALPAPAKSLLSRVEKEGSLRAGKAEPKAVQAAARTLESRLLVLSSQVHTETGAHARVLESWRHWAKRVKMDRIDRPMADARRQIEKTLVALSDDQESADRLPWPAKNP